jgi:adenosylhomocysteine nucleosidase
VTPRRANRRTFIVLLAASLSCGWSIAAQTPATQTPVSRPVVVLGVPAEVKDVEARLTRVSVERVQGVPFSVGFIGSTRVILGKTNAGKVNAAMMTALAVNHYSPSAVFFTGTAGAVDPALKPGDVVLGTAIGYHDFGAATAGGFIRRATNNPVSGGVNPAFFAPDERLVSAARRLAPALMLRPVPGTTRVPAVHEGVIVTGDAFVANPAQRDEMRRSLKAAAVEMEGAAVAQVCSQLGVPFIVIRSITDNADGGTIDDYRTNLDAASRNAATLTLAVISEVVVRK